MTELEKRAKLEAEIHTLKMMLVDVNLKLNPDLDITQYLNTIQSNVEAEKNRIINRTIRGEN
ncbi:MAG TPA: hypothetical protein DF610_16280 [Sphingobacterium sp.]|nr:hypothetical protein FM120_31320 [Sphingobacterium faecium PCAi_F2.5]HCU46192.1 hypothetical protein [Sphingobacterium sp.]